MMVLLMSDAFVAGHGRALASRVRTAQVLMRELFFSELDERRAVAFLQQWPKRRFRDGVNTWGNAEWQPAIADLLARAEAHVASSVGA